MEYGEHFEQEKIFSLAPVLSETGIVSGLTSLVVKAAHTIRNIILFAVENLVPK